MTEPVVPVETPAETVKPVSQEAYDQVKNDMGKYKRENQNNLSRVQELENEIANNKTAQLEQKDDYKGLYEQTNETLVSERKQNKVFTEAVIKDKKLSKVREQAIKVGMVDGALGDLEMLNLDDIVLETTSQGNFSVHGVDGFVEGLKQSRPHWFRAEGAPILNNTMGTFTPAAPESTYTPKQMSDLEKSDPAKYKDIMTNKRHLITRG